MRANTPKRKIFNDAVDVLCGAEDVSAAENGIQMLPIGSIRPFRKHPFRLYEGERLDDMVESIREHGILNPVIVWQDTNGYEMLAGHNRQNAGKLAGLTEVPAIVKTDLTETDAYVYVIETNVIQRGFAELLPSEKAAVLAERYEKVSSQGRRNDILQEIEKLNGTEKTGTCGHDDMLPIRETMKKQNKGAAMGKRIEMDLEEKVFLVEEYIAGRMKGREAARRAGVGSSTMQSWISRYRAEGIEGLWQDGNRDKRSYDRQTRRKVVEEYLSGKGSSLTIAEKYKLRSGNLVLDWVKEYHRHNGKLTGGDVMAKKRYTLEERVQVVKEHLENGKSFSEIADSYDLSTQLIHTWVKKYREMGLAGLEDRRGHRIAEQTPRTPEEELRIRNAGLERENYLLKMELDLLKKVKELERGDR